MLDYAIIIMIVGAFASLVGGWIKGPNWPRTVLIGLFLTLIGVAAVLMYVQSSSQPNDTSSSIATPTRITSSNEETATGRPQPTETPYTADEGATTERPQPTDTPYAEGRTIHPTELQVGDCFSFNNDDSSTQVSDVEVVDCSAPHLYEVYSNYQIPQSTFPDENTMKSEQYTACHDTFETYVGVPYDQSQYDATTLNPTENSWAQGDHAITCFLMSKDGSQLTGSLKGAAK